MGRTITAMGWGVAIAAWLSSCCLGIENGEADGPAAVTLYVAINGNDAWSGQLADPTPDNSDGPLRTLTQARDNIRKSRASPNGPFAGATVIVRAGTYRIDQTFTLDARDSGSPDRPTVYRTYPGESVLLVGGPQHARTGHRRPRRQAEQGGGLRYSRHRDRRHGRGRRRPQNVDARRT